MERVISKVRGSWLRLRTDEKGALGAEWVVIVAILILAALGILYYTMESADGVALAVDGANTNIGTAVGTASAAPALTTFGNGTVDN